MIKYDLKCEQDHRFEAWFRDSAGYDEQRAAGEVTCPHCGSTAVEKAPMAPRLAGNGKAKAEMLARMRTELTALRQKVEENCDYVGPRFAEEARKIHYGESEARGIYGETSADEAKELADEGVAFSRVPWLPKDNA